MRIQIDTETKTIRIEETVNLGEFTIQLEQLLPNGLWKEFKLEAVSIIQQWTNPIIYPVYPYPNPYPLSPPIWYQPFVGTTDGTSNIHTLNSGIFNLVIGDITPAKTEA